MTSETWVVPAVSQLTCARQGGMSVERLETFLKLTTEQMESTVKGLAMAISVPVSTTVRPTVGEVMAANEWCPELIMGVANTTKVAQNPCVVALLAKAQTPVIQVCSRE